MTNKTSAIEKLDGRNDNNAATRFIDDHGSELRYVYSWDKWLAWTGRKWCIESGKNRVYSRARTHARKIWKEAGKAILSGEVEEKTQRLIVTYASQANDAKRIEAKIKLSQHDERIAIRHKDLDSDPYLLNCLNGTLEMKSGTFRDHQQEDLLTQIAGVNYKPDATCPLWEETLGLIFDGNQDLIDYVQSLFGYSLVGTTTEHILPIAYGDGNNGKSTIWNAFHAILGDYACMVRQDVIMPKSKDGHPTEMADLFGKRFVAVGEPEQGRAMKESQVKELTGDSTVRARRMREDFWEFTPTHTFWLSTNHKPKIKGTDNGIWRRLKLIPFLVNLGDVTEVDTAFPEKLKAEYSGILNWAIAGWQRYQELGLVEPKVVTDATCDYRNEEDVLGRFLAEAYVENSSFFIKATDAFEEFVKATGSKMNRSDFGSEMAKRFERDRMSLGGKKTTIYRGIGLLE